MMLTGEVMWAKIQPEQVDRKFPDKITKGGYWSMDLILDKENKKKVVEAGLKHRIKYNSEEGHEYLKLTRKELRQVTDKATGEKTIKSNNPVVVMDGLKNPYTGLIGNKSLVNVSLRVYPISFTDEDTGTTIERNESELEKVQIVNLVVFEAKRQEDEFPVIEGYNSSQSTGQQDNLTKENEMDAAIPF